MESWITFHELKLDLLSVGQRLCVTQFFQITFIHQHIQLKWNNQRHKKWKVEFWQFSH